MAAIVLVLEQSIEIHFYLLINSRQHTFVKMSLRFLGDRDTCLERGHHVQLTSSEEGFVQFLFAKEIYLGHRVFVPGVPEGMDFFCAFF